MRKLAKPVMKAALEDKRRRIRGFLEDTPVGVLSTIDPSGEPHGVVIYFSVDENLSIYFVTRDETRKYDNLTRHNHAMLTVFDAANHTTAQVTGRAREIKDNDRVNELASQMVQANFKVSDLEIPPITKLEAGEVVAFRLEPVQIRMAVYARPESGTYAELFESLESFNLYE